MRPNKCQRLNKFMLWSSTIVVALFGFFPNYLEAFLGDAKQGAANMDKLDQIELIIEGMTCEACALPIQNQLAKVDGVSSAHVDYAKSSADHQRSQRQQNPPPGLAKTVEDAGYRAKFQDSPTKTISIEGATCEACTITTQKK